jgi:3-dehydroquinate synthase
MVKTAAIGSPALFDEIERAPEKALGLEPDFIGPAVHQSLRIKAAVVESDERETGARRVLNFGHTLGHALEAVAGLDHGQAVAAGLVFAAGLSVRKGFLAARDRDRISALVGRLGLPAAVDAPAAALVDAVRKDKKRAGDGVHFVFLEAIGRPLVREIPMAELESAIHDLR